MKNLINRWKNKNKDLDKVENHLQRNFIPIIPSQDFVAGLRNNLLIQFPQEVEEIVAEQRTKLQTGLVVTGGIFGGILIVLSGVRGFVSLLGVFILLINWFRNHQKLQRV